MDPGLFAERVILLQITPDCRRAVYSAGLEDVDQVAACLYYYRVPVLADLPVGLGVQVRCGDQYAELAMPQPRDESACFPDADAVGLAVAFGFEGELDGDGIRTRTEVVIPDGVAAAVPPWARDIDPVHVRLAHAPQVRGELLEVVRPVPEVLVNQIQQRPVRGRGLLLMARPDDHGGRGKKRRVTPGLGPGSPGGRATAAERLTSYDLVDPAARYGPGVKNSKSRAVVLESLPARH